VDLGLCGRAVGIGIFHFGFAGAFMALPFRLHVMGRVFGMRGHILQVVKNRVKGYCRGL
jgi:hypothetical protein